MNKQLKGLIFILIGAALIFPLLSQIIFKNIVVIIGVLLIYVGVKKIIEAHEN